MSKGVSIHPHLCSELVTITGKLANGRVQSLRGNLEEIGEWSAVVLAERPWARGSQVSIKTDRQCLQGVVKSFDYDPTLGYFTTISLNAESRWSQEWFTPEHLLALWSLESETAPAHAPSNAA